MSLDNTTKDFAKDMREVLETMTKVKGEEFADAVCFLTSIAQLSATVRHMAVCSDEDHQQISLLASEVIIGEITKLFKRIAIRQFRSEGDLTEAFAMATQILRRIEDLKTKLSQE